MPPSTTYIATQLRQLIYYHLDNNLLDNALFLAGRLSAYEPRSPEAAYLQALCQFQSGHIKAAWDSSRIHATRGNHLGCCYIYAQASLELGRYVEGITALERSKNLWQMRNSWNQHNETRRQHLPDAAAIYCLEGKLFKAHRDLGKAVDCWAEALKLNPFMWDAFLGLCDAGAKVNVPNIYRITPDMVAMLQAMKKLDAGSTTSLDKTSTSNAPPPPQPINHTVSATPDPFSTSQSKVNGISNHGSTALWEKLNGSKVSVATVSTIAPDPDGMETPTTQIEVNEDMRNGPIPKSNWEPPLAPTRKARSNQEIGTGHGGVPPPKMRTASSKSRSWPKADFEESTVLQDPPPPALPTKRTISGQAAQSKIAQYSAAEGARRSGLLLNRPPTTAGSKISSFASSIGLGEGREIKKARATGTKARIATTATVGRVVSGNRTRPGSSDAMDNDTKEPRHLPNNVPPVPSIPPQHHRVPRTEPQQGPRSPPRPAGPLQPHLHRPSRSDVLRLSDIDPDIQLTPVLSARNTLHPRPNRSRLL